MVVYDIDVELLDDAEDVLDVIVFAVITTGEAIPVTAVPGLFGSPHQSPVRTQEPFT